MKFRWHRGSLADSMATLVEVSTMTDLATVIRNGWHDPFCDEDLAVEPYLSGPDNRIGWADTWAVTVNDMIIGFTDGPFKKAGLAA